MCSYLFSFSQSDTSTIQKGLILQLLYPINKDSSFKYIKVIKHEYDVVGSSKIIKLGNEFNYNDYGGLQPIANGFIIIDSIYLKKKQLIVNCKILTKDGGLIRSNILVNNIDKAIQEGEILNTGKYFKTYSNLFDKYFEVYSDFINRNEKYTWPIICIYSFIIFLLLTIIRKPFLKNEHKFALEPAEIYLTNQNFVWLHWLYSTNDSLAEFYRLNIFDYNEIVKNLMDADVELLKNRILRFNESFANNKKQRYLYYKSDNTTKGGAKEWVLWEIANLNLLLATSKMNKQCSNDNEKVEELISNHTLLRNNVGENYFQIVELLGLIQKKYS
jgi:hypothetical protein